MSPTLTLLGGPSLWRQSNPNNVTARPIYSRLTSTLHCHRDSTEWDEEMGMTRPSFRVSKRSRPSRARLPAR